MLLGKNMARIIGDLPKKVRLRVYSDEKMLEFVKSLANFSDSIDYEFVREKEKSKNLPGIEIIDAKIFFHMVPQHSELESFLLAIKLASETVAFREESLQVTTFVSRFCQNCRAVVDAVNKVAIKLGLEHHVIDVSQFPDLAEKNNVYGVPTVFVGEIILRGTFTDREFEKWVEGAIEEDYYDFIAYKLERGEIEDLTKLIDKTKTFAELIAHDNFFVRLGAMAMLEKLAKSGLKVSRETKEEIRKLLNHEDSRIREDAIMMLGILGEEEDIQVLQSFVGDENIGESAREAIQMIRDKYGD